jgi:hypothetical protein
MTRKISLSVVGHSASLFLLISYLICVSFDLIFPQHSMHQVWEKLLPGFEWLSWKTFFIGALGSYAYGWYISLVWVPLYNFFSNRNTN